jgi:hypothetical protein
MSKKINLRTCSIIILVVSFSYNIFGLNPNNWGDPVAYIHYAKQISFSSLLNFHTELFFKFHGYPLFIKLTSINFNYFYLVIISQYLIRLISIFYLEKQLRKITKHSYLVFLFSAFPKFIYMNNILFPDALICSLIFFLIAFLLNNSLVKSLICALLIFLLKPYLIILLLLLIILIINKKILILKYFKFEYYLPVVCAIILYYLSPIHVVPPMYYKIDKSNFELKNVYLCKTLVKEIKAKEIKLDFGLDFPPDFYINKSITSCPVKQYNKELLRLIAKKIITDHKISFLRKTFINTYLSFIGTHSHKGDHITSMVGVNFKEKKDFIINISKQIDYHRLNNIDRVENVSDLHVLNSNTLIDKFILVQLFFENKLIFLLSNFLFIIIIVLILFKKITRTAYILIILNLNIAISHAIFPSVVMDRYISYIIMINLIIILISFKNFNIFKILKLNKKNLI